MALGRVGTIKTIICERDCNLLKSIYYTYKYARKCGGAIIVGRKTNIHIEKTAKIIVNGKLFINISHTGKNNIPGIFAIRKNASLRVDGNFIFFSGCKFFVNEGAKMKIGSGYMNMNGNISCFDNISIGNDVRISEDVIIRDSDDHQVLRSGFLVHSPVYIGSHVWIGMRAIILKSARIGDGSILGANSLLRSDLPAASIAVGSPAKIIEQNIEWQ